MTDGVILDTYDSVTRPTPTPFFDQSVHGSNHCDIHGGYSTV